MHVRTHLTRHFATFGPLCLQPPFNSVSLFFPSYHWAGLRLFSTYFYFAESCVFIKQSLLPLFFLLFFPFGFLFSLSYEFLFAEFLHYGSDLFFLCILYFSSFFWFLRFPSLFFFSFSFSYYFYPFFESPFFSGPRIVDTTVSAIHSVALLTPWGA